MSIVTVSTVSALLAAIHGAHSGDVIQLSPVNYAAWLFLRGDLSAAQITDSGNAAQAFMDPAGRIEAVPVGDVKVQ